MMVVSPAGGPASRRANGWMRTIAVDSVLWGVASLCIGGLAIGRWVTSSHLARIVQGSDGVPGFMVAWIRTFEVALLVGALLVFYFVVIRPWLRDRRPSSDGLFCLACVSLIWLDTSYNYSARLVSYNTAWVNLGSWNDKIIGWSSPNGARLASPLLALPGIYIVMMFGLIRAGDWMLTQMEARWPGRRAIWHITLLYAGFVGLLFVLEVLALRTGVWAYPSTVGGLTLFQGHYYQFPVFIVVFDGVMLTGFAVFRHTQDRDGMTALDRALDRDPRKPSTTALRFLSRAGMLSAIYIVGFMLPLGILASHFGGAWSRDVTDRSYFTSMCDPSGNGSCGTAS